MKPGCTRADSDCVLDPLVLSYELLKMRYLWTGAEPSRSQATDYLGDFGLFNQRLSKNKKICLFTHRRNLGSHVKKCAVLLRKFVPRQERWLPLETLSISADAVRMRRASIRVRSAKREEAQHRFDTFVAETEAVS